MLDSILIAVALVAFAAFAALCRGLTALQGGGR